MCVLSRLTIPPFVNFIYPVKDICSASIHLKEKRTVDGLQSEPKRLYTKLECKERMRQERSSLVKQAMRPEQ